EVGHDLRPGRGQSELESVERHHRAGQGELWRPDDDADAEQQPEVVAGRGSLSGCGLRLRAPGPFRGPALSLRVGSAGDRVPLRNWWYVGVSPDPWVGSAFAAISFATVLPAVRLGLVHVPEARPDPLRSGRRWRIAAAFAMLLAALAFPRYAFPFAWIFLWPL